jgi:hypothetical protein
MPPKLARILSNPQVRRLPRRRIVTLIAAWRCSDGIVIHADSQETVGEGYRKTVQKIRPVKAGDYEAIFTGAGNSASLLKSCIEKLKRRVIGSHGQGLPELLHELEEELKGFYENDVPLCPESDKEIQITIAACSLSTHEFDIWSSENIALCPIGEDGPALSGCEESLYHDVANRFSLPSMTLSQAALAGAYLMAVAENTSNYVRRPFQMAIVHGGGIWMEQEGYVQEMVERLKDYEKKVNEVFLACADTSIPAWEMEKRLGEFAKTAERLHRHHIEKTAEKIFRGHIAPNDLIPKLPPGSIVITEPPGWVEISHRREADEGPPQPEKSPETRD